MKIWKSERQSCRMINLVSFELYKIKDAVMRNRLRRCIKPISGSLHAIAWHYFRDVFACIERIDGCILYFIHELFRSVFHVHKQCRHCSEWCNRYATGKAFDIRPGKADLGWALDVHAGGRKNKWLYKRDQISLVLWRMMKLKARVSSNGMPMCMCLYPEVVKVAKYFP